MAYNSDEPERQAVKSPNPGRRMNVVGDPGSPKRNMPDSEACTLSNMFNLVVKNPAPGQLDYWVQGL